jgi:UDP-N-acetylmuramoylalanine--D-glutamate ligase
MKIEQFKDKKILILGYGREGRDTLEFLRKIYPELEIGIADKNQKLRIADRRVKLHLGDNYLDAIKNYDIIIKSPGINYPSAPNFTSSTEIFFNNFKGKIIGITGTKGKSSTSYMTYLLLKNAGYKAVLLGNIGKASLKTVLTSKEDDWCVYELSSHQLFNAKLKPHIAVLLNIYPEHLDYYKDFDEYANAKKNIAKYLDKKDYLLTNLEIKTKAQLINYKSVKNDKIHPDNLGAVCAIARILNITDQILQKTFNDYPGLEHRLEYVGNFKGIKFYNDSLATIPQATLYAIDTIGPNLDTIILGGHDRGIDYKEFANKVLDIDNLRTIIFFHGSGDRILKEMQDTGKQMPNYYFAKNMKEAVELCFKNAKNTCLLSCASPSFGMFKDYKDRGDQFKKYIKMHK